MFEELLAYFEVYRHTIAILVGMPRLFMIVMIVPFMGAAVLVGQLRLVLVGSLYLILHPALFVHVPENVTLSAVFTLEYLAILFKEIVIGLFLGYLGALIFWAVQSAGFLIDNQRGASQAETTDILSGESTTPTGAFFFQTICYLFFATGGFLSFISVVYSTYILYPPYQIFPNLVSQEIALFFAAKLGWLALNTLLLASPIIIACLLTDVSLGLMNRFASQLNVYILAMPIKSGFASFLLCFYFIILVGLTPKLYNEINIFIIELEHLLK